MITNVSRLRVHLRKSTDLLLAKKNKSGNLEEVNFGEIDSNLSYNPRISANIRINRENCLASISGLYEKSKPDEIGKINYIKNPSDKQWFGMVKGEEKTGILYMVRIIGVKLQKSQNNNFHYTKNKGIFSPFNFEIALKMQTIKFFFI